MFLPMTVPILKGVIIAALLAAMGLAVHRIYQAGFQAAAQQHKYASFKPEGRLEP